MAHPVFLKAMIDGISLCSIGASNEERMPEMRVLSSADKLVRRTQQESITLTEPCMKQKPVSLLIKPAEAAWGKRKRESLPPVKGKGKAFKGERKAFAPI